MLKKNILFFIILLFVDIFSVFPESLPEYLNGTAYNYMNMENNLNKQNSDKFQIKSKIKEFLDETNEIFESKIKQMNSIINSIKVEHSLLLSKSKLKNFILYNNSFKLLRTK